MREAYSHEVSSCGFWPGSGGLGEAAFYAYAYPEPAGFGDAPVQPAPARYDQRLGEFILPYDAVRQAARPGRRAAQFLQSIYEASPISRNGFVEGWSGSVSLSSSPTAYSIFVSRNFIAGASAS